MTVCLGLYAACQKKPKFQFERVLGAGTHLAPKSVDHHLFSRKGSLERLLQAGSNALEPAGSSRTLAGESSKKYPGDVDEAKPERIEPIEHRTAQIDSYYC